MKPELFRSLKGYKKENLISDIMSGLLVAIIALPLSIALGIQSGATLQAGIITAIVAGFFISFLGGSKFQIGGPTAAFVVIVLGYINDPEIGLLGLQVAAIFAGVILIILGITKAGGLIKYMPFPIVIGFTTGIGITLLIGQFKDFFGFIIPSGTNIGTINIATLIIGIITVLLIIFIAKINKKLPALFIALGISTLLLMSAEAIIGGLGVATIGSTYGEVEASFSILDFAGLGGLNLGKLAIPAIIIAFLAAIESLLCATVADGLTNTQHDPNQELVGQGVANIASSFMSGLPATGAIARTAANIRTGAVSPLSGIFHALFLLIMYLLLMPIVKFIPLTALSGVLIVVAFKMSNFNLFVRLATFTIRDTIILVSTCLLTIFFDLTYGVVGGVIVTIIANAKCLVNKLEIYEKNIDTLKRGERVRGEKKIALHIKGSICFVNVVKLLVTIRECAARTDIVILDFSEVTRVDVTSVEKLAKLSRAFAKQGKRLVLHESNKRVYMRFTKSFNHIIREW